MVDNKRIFVKGPLARRVLDACIIHCWSKPLADSGASKVSNGCAGLLVFLCVSSTCVDTSQHQYKPEESQPDNFLAIKLWSSQ